MSSVPALNEAIEESLENESSESFSFSDEESVVSECKSSCRINIPSQFRAFETGLVRLLEEDEIHDLIKYRFLSSLGSLGKQATVVAVHRNDFSTPMGQAKMQSFQCFAKAMEIKCGENANVKWAWHDGYCHGGIDEILKILKNGFNHNHVVDNNGIYGCGIYFSPNNAPLDCIKRSNVDGEGLCHMLLCRVILGKVEVVRPVGSNQCRPSSEEFDSGIDNLSNPKKYIVWSNKMNTHVLPEFVISFKAPSYLKDFFGVKQDGPTSPWIPFPALIKKLANILPRPSVALIVKIYKEYKDDKISREELVKKTRQIIGDKLIIALIKDFRIKQAKAASSIQKAKVENGSV